MRASALSLPLFAAALLASGPTGTAATDRNCRQCECSLVFGGAYKLLELDAFMAARVNPHLTGGGGYYWKTLPGHPVPHSDVVDGTVVFRRLCGTGRDVTERTLWYTYFPGGQTSLKIKCDDCGTHVKCKGGSNCPKSGLVD